VPPRALGWRKSVEGTDSSLLRTVSAAPMRAVRVRLALLTSLEAVAPIQAVCTTCPAHGSVTPYTTC